jgi:hypothetical protein
VPDRIIAAMSKNSIEFETLLSQHARLNMTENHLWLSLLLRPQKSSFTRVQRLCDNRVSNSILFFDIAAMIRSILPSPISRANQSSQKKIKLKKRKKIM